MAEIIEWIKTIGASLVILALVVSLMLIGVEIAVVFSSGHWGWALLMVALYLVALYFAVRWTRQP